MDKTQDLLGSQLLLASDALRRGEARAALEIIDGWQKGRSVRHDARFILLRAAALSMLDYGELAHDEVKRAREMAPFNPSVLSLGLNDTDSNVRFRAARALLFEGSTTLRDRRHALTMLLRSTPLVVNIQRRKNRLHGWAFWRVGSELRIRTGARPYDEPSILSPDRQHPLASLANVINFSLYIDNLTLGPIDFYCDSDIPIESFGPYIDYNNITTPVCLSKTNKLTSILIIIPVYKDAAATKSCIDSLIRQTNDAFSWRAIIVNDASPDTEMKLLLLDYENIQNIEIINNEKNMGFSSSVNRALLKRNASEDVLLLNSDVVLPDHALMRLRSAAWSSDDIGTVTPLSNNGEQCSIPIMNHNNQFPTPRELNDYDNIVQNVGGRNVVDMPNGIGFCLYVKSSAANAVGYLSEDYGRGYYEDVDYCLRIRYKGFRNVCAVGIYVGHIGSRSFGPLKSELVHKNLKLLDSQHPGHRVEFAAFNEIDPVGPWRRLIVRALPAVCADILLVTDENTLQHLLDGRCHQHRQAGMAVRQLTFMKNGSVARIHDAAGDFRNTVEFSLPGELVTLSQYLQSLNVSRIETTTPLSFSPLYINMFYGISKRLDPLITDATAATQRFINSLILPNASSQRPGLSMWKIRDPEIESSPRIQAINTLTYYFAIRHSGLEHPAIREANIPFEISNGLTGKRLGVFAPVWNGEITYLIKNVTRELCRRGFPQPIVFVPELGYTIGDTSNICQIRYNDPIEIATLFQIHQIRAALFPYRSMLPEPEHDISFQQGLPCAYFDFSGGYYSGMRHDCRLIPSWSDLVCASHVSSWFERLN